MSEPTISAAGQALRELREEAGLSLRDFALRLGWDKGRLSKYENDRLALSTPVIEEIAAALEQRPVFVVLRLLKHKYPELRSRKELAALLKQLD